ncbi:NERD domain-containing protein [Nocardia abscessus]|uniref:nuclease-related domain-containing protein n=1 Tax=Nocardia abscessus TaxID=120957 RepID=UPI001895543F|nr:nuclease-related domain-containing protein [Nocardia abscessus]MBF6341296.1 NERD domain-containing protein [Nocardia abscessus]
MLVINTRSTIEPSEARVAHWMSRWNGRYAIRGVAIASYHLPGRDTAGQQADFVLLTPQVSAVIEVKGTHRDLTHGVITAEPNGRWHHSSDDRDPVHTRANDLNPIDQALSATYLFKALVEKHNPGQSFVSAVVVVVPPRRSQLRLQVRSLPTGCEVVLGNSGLRRWLHRTARRDPIWTAEQVYSLLNAMNLGPELTIPDLLAEGFPSLEAPPITSTARRAKTTTTVGATAPTASRPVSEHPPASDTRVASSPRVGSQSSRWRLTPRRRTDHRDPGQPEHSGAVGRPRHRRQQIAALVVVVAVWAAMWLLVAHYNPTPPSAPATSTPTEQQFPQLAPLHPQRP